MLFGLFDKAHLTQPARYATEVKTAGTSTVTSETKTYDYVIVGCGTAGAVLASRLSEDENVSVLVLEAGGDQRGILETKLPLTFSKLFHGVHDWDYFTTPQPQVNDRELYWPRGKMIGGSSSMNAMMYHHCSHSDFDEWVDKFGCTGWGYKDLQPFFRRSEKFTPNVQRPSIDLLHRGDAGLWHTGYSYLTEINEKGFLESCYEVGIPPNPDLNTPQGSSGASRFMTFIDSKGKRSSAATAYLPQHVINRKNLDIAVNVYVTRVLFDSDSNASNSDSMGTPTATGVEIQQSSTSPIYHIRAAKEVILAAGAINTPQTLKLSGIGPSAELKTHQIPIIKDLPAVGEHLKDHFCSSGIIMKAKPEYTLDYLTYDDLAGIPAIIRWFLTGGGPVTSNVAEVAAFLRTSEPPFAVSGNANPKDYGSGALGPDLEIIGAPLAFIDHGAEKAPRGVGIASIVPINLRPQSQGNITLKSNSVFDRALIDPRYWTDAQGNDRKTLLVGLRVCLRLMRSEAYKKYLEPVEVNDDPESYWWPYSSSDPEGISDEMLTEWMGKKAFTLYHPVGSARMGPSPKDSVVDLECRVHGVKNLRVVDASIFPEQISGHPTAPIIAIAEKMSDILRGKL